MTRLRPLRLIARLLLGLASFCWANTLSAGTGDIQNGKLNLLVYFAYEETDPSSWIPLFDEYSRLMLNSTEGALQLGTVEFTRCASLQNRADIWILNDFSGARAHLSGLGRLGLHMTISQVHKSTTGSSRGQFGLLHESGHYLWGCYDEYLGFIGNLRQRSPLHFCSLDLSNVGCIMDGGTTVFPNNRRTEFCTDSNLDFLGTRHNQGVQGIHPSSGQNALVVNDQQFFLGRSCWSQMARSGVGGLSNQTSIPTQDPPPHTPVVYDLSRFNGDLAVSLLIDVSGSMSAEGRLDQAVLGGQVSVGLLREEESLSIVAFSDTAQVVFSQKAMTSAAKASANSVLDNLVAGGGTAAGLAVLAGLGQLAGVSGCVELIVIITDGVSAAPNLADPSVLAALAAGGQAVYGIAIGSFPEVADLNALATSTGGAFYNVSEASQLPLVLANIFSLAGSGTALSTASGARVPPGGSFQQPIAVAQRDSCLRLSLSHAPGALLELFLTTPDGARISAQAPPPEVSVSSHAGGLSLSVPEPQAGAWSAEVEDPLNGGQPFDLLVFVEGAELDVNTFASEAQLSYPAPMQLSVSLVAGVPVGGAQVSGLVRRPDGSQVPCLFFDDGLAVHGDAKAADGVYSTLFARYVGDGAYTFDVLIDAQSGMAASNEECGIYGRGSGEDGQSTFPVPSFQACASHTLLLEGQSSIPAGPATVSLAPHARFAGPDAIDVLSAPATPLAAFELQVGPSEPVVLNSLRLDFLRSAGQAALAQDMLLHLDRDGDGQLDVPSVPLASGQLSADSACLDFQQPGGELAWLDAGSRTSFLLSLGEGVPPALLARAAEPGAAGGSLALAPGRGAWLFSWLLAGWLAWLFMRARRRGPERREPRRGLLPLVLSLLLLLFSIPACDRGSESSRVAPASDPGAQLFQLSPQGLRLGGAVSELPAAPQGPALDFDLDLLPR